MNNSLPRLLIVGYYGKGNFGDQLMVEQLVASLPDSEITIIAYKETPFILPGVNIVLNNKKKNGLLFLYNILKNFYRCDVVIWGGGTCFYDNVYNGLKHLYGLTKIYLLTRIFRKKMIFLGVGIGEIIHRRNKLIVKHILKNSELVTVRDLKSLDYISNNLIRGNIHRTEDLAYLCNYPLLDVPHISDKIIFCGLSYNDKPGYDDNIIALNLARILDNLIEAGYLIDMVPMHLGNSYDDVAFNKMVYEYMKHKEKCRLVCISPLQQVTETMQVLAAATAVVSMRLHGLIAGLILGKVVCAISDSKKIHSFMLEIGLKADLLSINELATDDATSLILNSVRKQAKKTGIHHLKRSESYENINLLKNILLSSRKK